MRILVDADACPVKEIIVQVAKKKSIPVIMIIDSSHELHDNYSTIITVEKAKDSVDMALINMAKNTDIIITQDYGLAALALGKGSKALNQNGLIYSNENIDILLMQRCMGQKIRRGGGRSKGPYRRTRKDDELFKKTFIDIVEGKN